MSLPQGGISLQCEVRSLAQQGGVGALAAPEADLLDGLVDQHVEPVLGAAAPSGSLAQEAGLEGTVDGVEDQGSGL